MSNQLVKLFATFFHIGFFPKGPGTLASAAGMLIYVVLWRMPFLYVLLTIVVTIIGFKVCGPMEKLIKEKDPSCVVIDEVAGVMIAFFMLPLTPAVMWTTFFLFRALDMFKLYPVNKFEEMEGGTGIMMDDLFAGLYTNIVMQIAIRWAGVI